MGENIFTAFVAIIALFCACCLDSDQWQRFLFIFIVCVGWIVIWLIRHDCLYIE